MYVHVQKEQELFKLQSRLHVSNLTFNERTRPPIAELINIQAINRFKRNYYFDVTLKQHLNDTLSSKLF
jgi:hypothetical protein